MEIKTKTELWVALILVVIISFTQYLCAGEREISGNFINNLTVFISIIFGFFATSLAIFATSTYSGVLYDAEDSLNGGTLLHTLIKKYKIGLIVGLISIIYLLGLQVFWGNEQIKLSTISASPLIALICINAFYAYRMVWIVSQFVLQEAKRS